MNSMRNLFITGVALFLGLSVPEYFREYTAKALHGPAHTRAGWVRVCLLDFFNFHALIIFSAGEQIKDNKYIDLSKSQRILSPDQKLYEERKFGLFKVSEKLSATAKACMSRLPIPIIAALTCAFLLASSMTS